MSETKMPAAEAAVADETNESNHYEFAFHVLPTVAEGEVAGVFDNIKAQITKAGGEFSAEEAPKRVDLAYEIVHAIDGKNRKFASAYFGWARFKLSPEDMVTLNEELEGMPELLRSLTIKLTRVEEAEPFYFHEAADGDKQYTTVGESEGPAPEQKPHDAAAGATEDEADKGGEVKEEELEDSLEKITQ